MGGIILFLKKLNNQEIIGIYIKQHKLYFFLMKIKFFIICFVTCLFVNSFTFAEEKSTDNFIERGFKKIFSKKKVEEKSSEKSLQKRQD